MKKVISYIAILIVVITIDVLFSLDNINIFKSITQGVIITMIILSVNIRSKSKQHPNTEQQINRNLTNCIMETWKIITNVILTVIILALTVVVIIDYIKHKDDESISAEDLKQLRKSHFIFAMLVAIGLLYSHICRFFV